VSEDSRGAAAELHENARRVLAIVGDVYGGEARKSQITSTIGSDVSGPNVYHHATSLVDEGYLRVVDQEAGDYGETTFGVTEVGEPVAKAAATSVTFADVDVRLDRQQAQIDQLRNHIEELRQDHEELADRHDGLIDLIEESDVL